MKLVFAQTSWLFTLLNRNHHRSGLGGVVTSPLETQTNQHHRAHVTFQHATSAMRAYEQSNQESDRNAENYASEESETLFDAVIIGAGWAGLAAGRP